MARNNDGVHQSHCCKRHGCKYCDDNCPVERGRIVQDHPCEACADEPKYRVILKSNVFVGREEQITTLVHDTNQEAQEEASAARECGWPQSYVIEYKQVEQELEELCPTHNKPMYWDDDPYQREINDRQVEMQGCDDCFQDKRDNI